MKHYCSVHLFQLKDVCRRELDRSEIETVRNQAVTSEYKQVIYVVVFRQFNLLIIV